MGMTRKLPLMAAVAALAVVALPDLGQAQSAPASATTRPADGAVTFGSDDVEYRPDGLSLIGRAEFYQGQDRLRADRVDFYQAANGDMVRAEARGNVYYVTPEQTLRGDRATYTAADNTLVLTGDVILTQGENVVTGGRVTYNTRTGVARMEGGRGGRVQGVFHPQRN